MTTIEITPINHPVNSFINVPGSKSLTNRVLMVSALASGQTKLENALFSDDSMYFAKALQTLGFQVVLDEAQKEITVQGLGGDIPARSASLYIGNAGTAARFLSAFLTLGRGEYVLDGDTRMRERPIGDLLSSLRLLGADVCSINKSTKADDPEAYPPIKIMASGLKGGKTIVAGNVSSQFLSALLMVSPYAQQAVEVTLATNLNSRPYIDMTLGVMAEFGISIKQEDYSNFKIQAGKYHSIERYPIEPDASAASYFFAIPSILGGKIRVANVKKTSKQGDFSFLDVLQKLGCKITFGDGFVEVEGPAAGTAIRGIEIDMRDIPDTAQTLAAIAPFLLSPTHIYGIASARVKESDRVSATCTELSRLGVKIEEHQDGMIIYPCDSFIPETIRTYNDHRMAMSFSLVGLRVPGIKIENPACVSKTFPEFFKVLAGIQ